MGEIPPMKPLRAAGMLAVSLLALPGLCHATVYELTAPDAVLFGREERVVTQYEDTLYDIARRYSLGRTPRRACAGGGRRRAVREHRPDDA